MFVDVVSDPVRHIELVLAEYFHLKAGCSMRVMRAFLVFALSDSGVYECLRVCHIWFWIFPGQTCP